jgi:hypothetical protein
MNTIQFGPPPSPFHQTASPEEVMQHFFNAFSLHDLQSCLWNLFETAIVTDYGLFDEPDQRSMLMSVYSQLLGCLDAGMKLYAK